MITFYINLDSATDKRSYMEGHVASSVRVPAIDGRLINKLDYNVDLQWKDPYHNRPITKGEVGCTLSHLKCWKLCVELDQPVVILEDDVKLLGDYESFVQKYSDYDFLYLSYKEMVEPTGEPINEDLKETVFSYWCNAYYVTPKVAKALINYTESNPIIPADEIVPAVLGVHRWENLNHWDSLNQRADFKVASATNLLFEPREGAWDNSSTETDDYWHVPTLHVLTCATDEEKGFRVLPDVDHNLGKGVVWQGGNMAEGPGGGQKINLIKDFISVLPKDDLVLFVDGYDTFFVRSHEEIVKRYNDMGSKIVFGAEKDLWPDQSLQFPDQTTSFKYLNSGCFIGQVSELRKFFKEPVQNSEDDQLYVQKRYLTEAYDVALDVESYLFFNMSSAENSWQYDKENGVLNLETNCYTCVVHGNGGGATKEAFERLYNTHTGYPVNPVSFDIPVLEGLFTEDWCQGLIDACEAENNWHKLPNDNYPGYEIRLNSMKNDKYYNEFRQVYEQTIKPSLEKYWVKLNLNPIRDLFVIKYDEAQQTHLPLHHDMSKVTCTVKLNDGYTGGELNFPRQGVSNANSKVGDCLCWEASVTHPHESLALKSGTKYSLVCWTQRWDEEGEYFESN